MVQSLAGYADVSFVLYVCHCIYGLGGVGGRVGLEELWVG